MSRFKIEMSGEIKQQWTIDDYIYIGSDSSCFIALDNVKLDKKIALIEIKNKNLYIKNLRQDNGLLVNGAKIIEAQLTDGDLIHIDRFEFVIHDSHVEKNSFALKSRSEYWNSQLSNLTTVAQTNFPVLLLGPSGAGKDVLAQTLHKHSPTNMWPFISVNCSALTETLIESELFGHVKGSFTGAIADRKGAFETARHGTLFLDEIGDLPYSLQAKLLRALENDEIRPVGSDRAIKTRVRIMAATHQNLYQKIREGAFRSDLFYRLNVITINVPSLKERIEDFDDFLYCFAKKMKVRFSHNAILALKKHTWPGNIRELKNVVSRISALYPKEYINENHIDFILNKNENLAHPPTGVTYFSENNLNQLSVIKEIEKQMILKRLTVNQGNQKRTALDLGMPKSTLHDRIKNYNIKINQFKI